MSSPVTAVLKYCIAARATLAELKQAADLIPNPALLINTLPVLEAQASSEIENIVTTVDRLFRHTQVETGADSATREALRYRRALLEGVSRTSSNEASESGVRRRATWRLSPATASCVRWQWAARSCFSTRACSTS